MQILLLSLTWSDYMRVCMCERRRFAPLKTCNKRRRLPAKLFNFQLW